MTRTPDTPTDDGTIEAAYYAMTYGPTDQRHQAAITFEQRMTKFREALELISSHGRKGSA